MSPLSPKAAATPVDVLILPSILDVKAASGLYQNFIGLRGRDLDIDCSEVSRLGGQCLQVLLAGVIAWRNDGQQLQFVNRSEAFDRAQDLFGVDLNSVQRDPLA